MPTDGEPLDALIDRIYDAAAGFCGWDEVLSDLARLLGGAAAVLGVVGPRCAGRVVQVGVDPASMARYLERHAGRNELEVRSASSGRTAPAGSCRWASTRPAWPATSSATRGATSWPRAPRCSRSAPW